jgi:type I restriction enzyme R subunit
MVWLTKWIREHVTDARVLIITDRTELDEQIEKVFLGVNELIAGRKRSTTSRQARLDQTTARKVRVPATPIAARDGQW